MSEHTPGFDYNWRRAPKRDANARLIEADAVEDYRKIVVPKLQHFVMECSRLQMQIDDAAGYLDQAIGQFQRDPADNEFQRGYLAALETVRREMFPAPPMRPVVDPGPQAPTYSNSGTGDAPHAPYIAVVVACTLVIVTVFWAALR